MAMQVANAREAAAFFLTRAIAVAVTIVLIPAPRYSVAMMTDMTDMGTSILEFLTWLIALPLFLLLRGAFGGAPPIVAGLDRGVAVTSSIGEIVSYISAVLIVMVIAWTVTAFVPGIFTALRPGGDTAWSVSVWFAISSALAVVAFLIFVALRGRMPGISIPEIFD